MSRRRRSSASPAAALGLNQVLAPLRDLGLRLHEIERRNLTGIDANLVLPRELLRELERALLHGDVGDRRLQRPVRLLDGRHRLDDRFAEAQLGAVPIPLRDDVLLARRVDLAILQQRLRERDLNARLQVRIEAADRVVRRRPRGVPRDAPRAGAPRQPLPDAGRREPVLDVHGRSPSREFDGGVTLLDRPSVVEKTGAYAPRLSPTRAASTSVSSRTIARSGLCSIAR